MHSIFEKFSVLTTMAIMYSDFVWQLLFEKSKALQITMVLVFLNQGGREIGKMAERETNK